MEHFYNNIGGWSTMNDQGVLLSTIIPKLNRGEHEVIKIAEIGVYMGRLTAMWCVELINRNIPYEYYAVDHFMGSANHDKTINYYQITVDNLQPILSHVNVIKNDSISESMNYPDNYFNIVYVDASHDYSSVKADLLAWYPKVKQGGIFCGDDYTSGWPGVVKAVNEVFGNDVNKVASQQWWVLK